MAHHQSAKKRIRQIAARRLRNRYYAKTARNLIRDLKAAKDKASAAKLLPTVISNVDKLAKKGNIHKNKASNLKSKLTKLVNSL
jgi:small subunit ribosomal protein S20